MLELLVTSIWHWACPSRWSWSSWNSGVSSGSILVLTRATWHPTSLNNYFVVAPSDLWCISSYTQTSFLTGFALEPLLLPSRWPPRNKVELWLLCASNSARFLTTIVGRNKEETMKLLVEWFWPKWFIHWNNLHNQLQQWLACCCRPRVARA